MKRQVANVNLDSLDGPKFWQRDQHGRLSRPASASQASRPRRKARRVDADANDSGNHDRTSPPPGIETWKQMYMSWNQSQQLAALNELMSQCQPPRFVQILNVIQSDYRLDIISRLPNELTLHVFSFLDPKNLVNATTTCRTWRALADDGLLWKKKCHEAGIHAISNRIVTSGEGQSAWKKTLMWYHNVEMNWRWKRTREPQELECHTSHNITCLLFVNDWIISGSSDRTLRLWCARTGFCFRAFKGHGGEVWSAAWNGTELISGSVDQTVRVWDPNSGVCTRVLIGHTSVIRCLQLNGKTAVSGSRDTTLRIWNIATGVCLHVLEGHTDAVKCVQYDGNLIISGSYDCSIRVWDPNTGQCLRQLLGHTDRVYSLSFDGVHVYSGGLDMSVRIWEAKTGICKHTLTGHTGMTSTLAFEGNLLASGGADMAVKIWDRTTGQCLFTLSGENSHEAGITGIRLLRNLVVTSSLDGTVKLWDIKTGTFIRNLVTIPTTDHRATIWRMKASETKLICAVSRSEVASNAKTRILISDFAGDNYEI